MRPRTERGREARSPPQVIAMWICSHQELGWRCPGRPGPGTQRLRHGIEGGRGERATSAGGLGGGRRGAGRRWPPGKETTRARRRRRRRRGGRPSRWIGTGVSGWEGGGVSREETRGGVDVEKEGGWLGAWELTGRSTTSVATFSIISSSGQKQTTHILLHHRQALLHPSTAPGYPEPSVEFLEEVGVVNQNHFPAIWINKRGDLSVDPR